MSIPWIGRQSRRGAKYKTEKIRNGKRTSYVDCSLDVVAAAAAAAAFLLLWLSSCFMMTPEVAAITVVVNVDKLDILT